MMGRRKKGMFVCGQKAEDMGRKQKGVKGDIQVCSNNL